MQVQMQSLRSDVLPEQSEVLRMWQTFDTSWAGTQAMGRPAIYVRSDFLRMPFSC